MSHVLTTTILAALLLVPAAGASGPVIPTSLTVTMNPDSPSAGNPVHIDCTSAPGPDAKVELWIDGSLVQKETIDEIPGTATLEIPSTAAGKDYEIIVTSGTEQETFEGVVL